MMQILVSEALERDLDSNNIRISKEIASQLDIKKGDYVRVINPMSEKDAVGIYAGSPLSPDSEITLPANIRKEIGIGLGERVDIEKITPEITETVVLTPNKVIVNLDAMRGILEEGIPIPKVGRVFEVLSVKFVVKEKDPADEWSVIVPESEIFITEPMEIGRRTDNEKITWDDIGGLDDEIQKVREMIEIPMKYPEIPKRMGIHPPKGVLLHGPPGTGKTLIAKALANESGASFISIKGPEIMNKFYGQSEENLRKVFEKAKKNAPSILFIDEIDSIAPKRDETGNVIDDRIVGQLLALMDGLEDRGEVVVIGATNRLNSIDDALRRPGRFDREIEIGVPSTEGRLQILQIHTRKVPLADDVDLQKLADETHGYVGADLEALVKEAVMISIREHFPEIVRNGKVDRVALSNLRVTMNDFKNAMKTITPSAIREFTITIPKETWDDIGGLKDVKEYLRQTVEWKMKYPKLYKRLNGKPSRGILLYGPPGTGKTLIAKALAHEANANFISVKGPELLSKWFGESERAVRKLFKKARQAAPCIIFFDEIDSIASYRGSSTNGVMERIVSQLLTEIDGIEETNDIIIIAATNRPDIIDPALLRAGRLDIHIEIGLPDEDARKEILKIHLKDTPISREVTEDWLIKMTKGLSGAEIEAVCAEASNIAIRRYVNEFKADIDDNAEVFLIKKDFEDAMKRLESTFMMNRKSYKSSNRRDLYS